MELILVGHIIYCLYYNVTSLSTPSLLIFQLETNSLLANWNVIIVFSLTEPARFTCLQPIPKSLIALNTC